MDAKDLARATVAHPSGSSLRSASEHGRTLEGEPGPLGEATESACERLDTWKEIASYFRRSVRCVQRWERHEGMPVHRHRHSRAASIYAYRSELGAWWHAGSISEFRRGENSPPVIDRSPQSEGHNTRLENQHASDSALADT